MRHGRKFMVHQLVAEAFVGPSPGPEFTIDHIDRNTLNNHADNLSWATKSDQNKNRSLKREQGVRRIQVDTGSGWVTYASMHQLSLQTSFVKAGVLQVLRGERLTYKGALFRYEPTAEVDNEIWASAFGFDVSDQGRFRRADGIVYTPVPSSTKSGYCRVSNGGNTYMAHTVVATAFHGPPPGVNMSVDHLNRIRHDNRASNLRWANSIQQAENKRLPPKRRRDSRSTIVTARHSNGDVQEFSSMTEAVDAIGVPRDVLRNRCSPKSPSAGKRRAGSVKWGEYVFEFR